MLESKKVSLNGRDGGDVWLVHYDKLLHEFGSLEAAVAFVEESLECEMGCSPPLYRARELGLDIQIRKVQVSIRWLDPLGHGLLCTTVDGIAEGVVIDRLQYDALAAAGVEVEV